MRVAFFSTQNFEKPFLEAANKDHRHELEYFETQLNPKTATMAAQFPAISCFYGDQLNAEVLEIIAKNGTRLIAMRSTGINNIDIDRANKLGLTIVRVPTYSPHAVAEFTIGLILALNRKIHRAYLRVREHNFSLDGLLGRDLYNCTVGIIGTGTIGTIFARIMHGFGCKLLAHDPIPNESLDANYVTLDELYHKSDIISLHCQLTPKTYHIINEQALSKMKSDVMLINTGHGALIDTNAVISALKKQKIGSLGIDVYEEQEELLFKDFSKTVLKEDVLDRLQSFPNVIVTGHQAFFTKEGLTHIAQTTLSNISYFQQDPNKLKYVRVV